MEGKDLSINISSIWILQCAKGVYKTAETGNDSFLKAGSQDGDLLRGFPLDGPEKGLKVMQVVELLEGLKFMVNWVKSQLLRGQQDLQLLSFYKATTRYIPK